MYENYTKQIGMDWERQVTIYIKFLSCYSRILFYFNQSLLNLQLQQPPPLSRHVAVPKWIFSVKILRHKQISVSKGNALSMACN